MSKARAEIEAFLRNVNFGDHKYSEKVMKLDEEAKKQGIKPCEICDNADDYGSCGTTNCYAWYRWFKRCWKSIQADAREKGLGK